MPIFEYTCAVCGTTFERLTLRPQTVGQIPCPQCGSGETTKVLSTFSTHGSAEGGTPGSAGNSVFR